jgi:ATP-dependent protease ClpP protease subunit
MKLPYCPIFVVPRDNGTKEYTALINSTITSPTEYFGLVEIINRMQEGDDMILNISSPGGYVCSATFIASSIYRCKGTVTTVATSICASAGSLIWSSGHICKAHPTAQFMYHMSSQMSVGNSVRIRDSANVQVKYVQEVLLDLAKNKGHITEAEVDLICKDPDKCVWIDAKKMMERIANHIASGEK